MLVRGGTHAGYGAHEFLDFLTQGTRSFSMQNSHRRNTQHDGIVNISHDDVDGVRHALPAYVQFQLEGGLALADGRIKNLPGAL